MIIKYFILFYHVVKILKYNYNMRFAFKFTIPSNLKITIQ